MLTGYMSSIMESISDYAAVCSVTDTEFSEDTINRGITVEGLASAGSVFFGGLPMTSYSQNIGIIATTGIASRRVIVIAGLFYGLYGLVPKIGILITSISSSVLGGAFLVLTGMIAVSGLWMVSNADRSRENLLIGALTIVLPLALPHIVSGTEFIESVPETIKVLLTSSIVLAVLTGILVSFVIAKILDPLVSDGVHANRNRPN